MQTITWFPTLEYRDPAILLRSRILVVVHCILMALGLLIVVFWEPFNFSNRFNIDFDISIKILTVCAIVSMALLNNRGLYTISATGTLIIVLSIILIYFFHLYIFKDVVLYTALSYQVITIILLNILFSLRISFIFSLILIVSILSFSFFPQIEFVPILNVSIFLSVASAVMLVSTWQRNILGAKSRTLYEEQEELFSTISELSPDFSFVVDKKCICKLVNTSTTRITGYSLGTMVNESILDFIDNHNHNDVQNAIKTVFENPEQTFNLHGFRFKFADGSWHWLDAILMQIPSKANIDGVVVYCRDITSARESEEHRSLLEEELRQSEKMRAIGQLAGGIAHDFNNHLTAILANADMIRNETPTDSHVKEFSESIIKSARRSGDLTSKLLAFARRSKTSTTVVDIHEIINEVFAVLSRSIDKRIILQSVLHATPHSCKGDPSQISNALLNIALNARDAMPNGGYLLFATSIIEQNGSFCSEGLSIDPGRYIEIRISDTGNGIDSSTKARIFEPFFTTKDPGKGTGMGLSVVYGTVKCHHGTIEVDSVVGSGTTFRILLPCVNDVLNVAPEIKPQIKPKLTGSILILDDEELVGKVACSALKKLGFSVKLEVNPEIGIAYYKDHSEEINLVIIDMIMPRMNGVQVFEELKKVNKNVRIIFTSGYDIDPLTSKVLKENNGGFIQKPFDVHELHSAVLAQIKSA